MTTGEDVLSSQQFEALFQSVCNWGIWGKDDERGTLNYITADCVRNAAALVRSGRTVSMAVPINNVAGPDNPHPVAHYMTQSFDDRSVSDEPGFALDYLAGEIHGDCQTHIDALCHVAYKGQLYNGKAATGITTRGPNSHDITTYAHGIVGRGVLLDIPRIRGIKWLEPGDAVTPSELEQCEQAEGVRLRQGDILIFRTGHHRRRLELGPWNNGYDGEGKAGLHSSAITLLHDRKVAAFFPDGDGETVPSGVEGIPYPIHALQIAAMGMICADSLNLEDISVVCEEEHRWEFLVVAAPLRLPRGTGSFFNPIAIF
ncbi:MAG TPA: cyclase family protein [Alloacidobacterium sp.]|jgi:kynurenine formamidase|nr:cyclase family protein [Alloacidobacterium sp.]